MLRVIQANKGPISRDKFRVVTRYVGSGIKGVGSEIRRVGSGITAPEAQAIGLESTVLRAKDQALLYLWDKGLKFIPGL